MDVVCHCSARELVDQRHAIETVERLQRTAETDDVAFVAVHGAIDALLSDSMLVERVESLAERGVSFRACEQSLQHRGVEGIPLTDGVESVPVGGARIVRLQKQGYAYLKVP